MLWARNWGPAAFRIPVGTAATSRSHRAKPQSPARSTRRADQLLLIASSTTSPPATTAQAVPDTSALSASPNISREIAAVLWIVCVCACSSQVVSR